MCCADIKFDDAIVVGCGICEDTDGPFCPECGLCESCCESIETVES